MNMNNIIGEIHRVREKQAEECGFDPKRIGERIRQCQRERAAGGVRYPSFVARRGCGIVRGAGRSGEVEGGQAPT